MDKQGELGGVFGHFPRTRKFLLGKSEEYLMIFGWKGTKKQKVHI